MDSLAGIDTSAIEELMQIKADEEVLAERLRRMSEMRTDVSPVVFARVEKDYRSRSGALEDRAKPLKEKARTEYRRLETIHRRLTSELEAARLDKEEKEFRHRIGEFDDTAFSAQLKESEERLATRELAMSEAESLRQRFVAAFHSEQELASTGEPTPPTVAAPGAPPTSPREAQPSDEPSREPVPAPAGTLRAEAALPSAPARIEVPASTIAAEASATVIGPHFRTEDGITRPMEAGATIVSPTSEPIAPPMISPAAPVLPPPLPDTDADGTVIISRPRAAPAAAGGALTGATIVLPTARLVSQEEGLEPEFLLGPVTFIGRTSECQVRLARPAISRRHARIDLAPDGGHLVTDLQSENGTYVNGARVSEKRLADGDLVAFGTVRFIFRSV